MGIAGVDGCHGFGGKARWLAAVDSEDGSPITVVLADSLQEIVADPSLDVVAVDIPIGLSSIPPWIRACDDAARWQLGWPRSSSVFSAPIRQTLDAADYESASAGTLRWSGKKMTRQAFGILDKIREADALLTLADMDRVFEVHPEVSFWAMGSGVPNVYGKHTLLGREERREFLAAVFDSDVVETCTALMPVRAVAGLDDLYDALAALWTARRIKRGVAGTLPEEPSADERGLPMRIVY